MKLLRRIILFFLFILPLTSITFSSLFSCAAQAEPITPLIQFAEDKGVNTTFFGRVEDDGKGCSVFMVLNLIIDILTGIIGIAAVIGISVAGIQYLTAKGNEQQATKAKRRIYEIVIGLFAYVILYGVINFLLPGGKFSTTTCPSSGSPNYSQSGSNQQPQNTIPSNSGNNSNSQPISSTSTGSNQQSQSVASTVTGKEATSKRKRKKISEVGVSLAWPSTTTQNGAYSKRATTKFTEAMDAIHSNKGETNECRKRGESCGMFVGTVIRYSGVDKNMPTMASRIYNYVRGVGKYASKGGNKKWAEVKDKTKAQPGDIALKINEKNQATHVAMYVKNQNGKTVTAEANLCIHYGVMYNKMKYTKDSSFKLYRYVGG